MALRIKRVYERPKRAIGNASSWIGCGRGALQGEARITARRKDLAPSGELRRWFGHDADRWEGLLKRYRAELEEAGKTEDLRKIGERAAERNVTLLFGAKDAEHNNAQGSRPSCASSVVQRRRLGN